MRWTRAEGQGSARSAAWHSGSHQGQHRHRRSHDRPRPDRWRSRVGRARDAFIVERLRAAGAVILGKTNLSEWANFRSTKSTSGWSGRGGQTRNPYSLDRNPCGSSSGTGAAVAAESRGDRVGTETDGSIVCPSSINGLVGIKPTVGLVSRSGIIPISRSQDTAGPMARTVRDAALLLPHERLRRARRRDASRCGEGPADYVESLDPNALKGARIGVPRKRSSATVRPPIA